MPWRKPSQISCPGASPASMWQSLMIDGIEVDGQCVVLQPWSSPQTGTKVPVGIWLGDTENKTVVTELLSDLVARGLSASRRASCA